MPRAPLKNRIGFLAVADPLQHLGKGEVERGGNIGRARRQGGGPLGHVCLGNALLDPDHGNLDGLDAHGRLGRGATCQ